MKLLELIHPEKLTIARQQIQKCVNTGGVSIEYPFIRKDGKTRFLAIDAVKLSKNRFIGFVSDITERKLADEKIKKQAVFLNNLIECSPGAIAILDSDRLITRINEEFTNLFQFSKSDVIGQPILKSLITENMMEEADLFWEKVKFFKGTSSYLETIRQTKSGKAIDVAIIGYSIILEVILRFS